MTDRELLQQALDALEMYAPAFESLIYTKTDKKRDETLAALRQRLAQPEPEPFCWMITGSNQVYRGAYAEHDARHEAKIVGGECVAFPLLAAAPQKGTI